MLCKCKRNCTSFSFCFHLYVMWSGAAVVVVVHTGICKTLFSTVLPCDLHSVYALSQLTCTAVVAKQV